MPLLEIIASIYVFGVPTYIIYKLIKNRKNDKNNPNCANNNNL